MESKCFKCKKPAVVRLDYCCQDLCANCFCSQFEKRVGKANREWKMVRRADVIAVAISGGKDSAAMLYVLTKLAKKAGGSVALKPVLIDEGIHPYRTQAIAKAKALCKKLGLKLSIFTFKELFGMTLDEVIERRKGKKNQRAACTYCGVFRKAALNKAAQKLGANKLAVGHNTDDIAQTFLMNLMRNEPQRLSRSGALSGLVEREGLVRRFKPLIYNPEIECAIYCTLRELPFHLGGCPYAGESFRATVKDFLNKTEDEYPGTKFNVLHSFLALNSNVEGKKKGVPIGKCSRCGEAFSGMSPDGLCKACEFELELNG